MKFFRKKDKYFLFDFVGPGKTSCVNMKKVDMIEIQDNFIFLYMNNVKWTFPFDTNKNAIEIFEKLKNLL